MKAIHASGAAAIVLALALPAMAESVDERIATAIENARRQELTANERARAVEERVAQAMERARVAIERVGTDGMLMLHGGSREVVKNAPFSADIVYRTEQVLADGNRIVRTTESTYARDSQGRTRQQRGSHTIRIDDPVAHKSWLVHPDAKLAIPLPELPHEALATPPALPDPAASEGAEVRPGRVIVRRTRKGEPGDTQIEVVKITRDAADVAAPPEVSMSLAEAGVPALTLHGQPLNVPLARRGKGVTENLGTRDVEGVRAEGTRTTYTLPAGAIGNEKPIVSTSERWYSSDLQAVVLARTSDPRSGDTIYRLANIRRVEPAAELFRVPPEYRER
jgi:hypothetical protein